MAVLAFCGTSYSTVATPPALRCSAVVPLLRDLTRNEALCRDSPAKVVARPRALEPLGHRTARQTGRRRCSQDAEAGKCPLGGLAAALGPCPGNEDRQTQQVVTCALG